MKQKEAIYKIVCEVIGGEPTAAVSLTDAQKDEAASKIADGLNDGSIEFSDSAKANYDTPAAVKTYARGALNNSLRRDKRLTGGAKYVPVAKGPRLPKDEQLTALTNLKKKLEAEGDQDNLNSVEQAIESKKAELAAAKPKAKSVSVDLTNIPDDIKKSLGL